MGQHNTDVVGRWRADWPPRGTEVIPEGHAMPHPGCGTEQWSFHCQLRTPTGEQHSMFCVFSRHEASDSSDQRLVMHSLRWARVDHADGFCISQSWLDDVALLRQAVAADQMMDPHFRTALGEALGGGDPVAPDRLLPGPVRVGMGALQLNYGTVGALRGLPDGSYEVSVTDECERLRLTFTPQKPAIAHGYEGVIPGRFPDGSDAQFAYLLPRCAVEGSLSPVGGTHTPVAGTGWHEHVFGGDWYRLYPHRAPDRSGEWARIQLDNGWELSAALLRHTGIGDEFGPGDQIVGVACSPEGERVSCTVTVNTTKPWLSARTLHTYPTGLDIAIAELDLCLALRASPPLTEIESVALGGRSIGEWQVCDGVMRGQPVQGLAWVDLIPFHRVDALEDLPRRFSPLVQAEIASQHPDVLTEESAARIIDAPPRVLDAIPLDEIHHALIAPIRYLTDAGGKHWRAFLVYIVAMMRGAPIQKALPVLAAGEILHSAMLAVDDIQDGSLQRRGRPAAHVVFGTAETLNAAYATAFQDQVIRAGVPDDISDASQLRLYRRYMQAIRMVNLGQALDIRGHTEAMETAVATGDPAPLLHRIRAVHRLKTSTVFSYLASDASWTSIAPDMPLEGVDEYWDAVGLAFQISDDVLDLRGLTGVDATGRPQQLRRAGEDLRAGKVTMPMAHAIRLLPRQEMRLLWKSVRGGGADDATVRRVAQTLIDCGAVKACYTEAQALVDNAWQLMPQAPSSYARLICRAIGLYAANRQGQSGDVT